MIEGGCLCGAVRFSASDPTEGAYCHCRRCQRSAGGPFMTIVKVEDTRRITCMWYAEEQGEFRTHVFEQAWLDEIEMDDDDD